MCRFEVSRDCIVLLRKASGVEGKIESGGTPQALRPCLHIGFGGTRAGDPRAAVQAKLLKPHASLRAWPQRTRCGTLDGAI